MILAQYFPLALVAAFSVAMVAGVLALSRRLTPPRPTAEKLETYECGERPIGDTRKPVDLKYYIYVLVFLIIDVEVIFLVPWAVNVRALGMTALVEILAFSAVLLVGWAYAWKEGLLRWMR